MKKASDRWRDMAKEICSWYFTAEVKPRDAAEVVAWMLAMVVLRSDSGEDAFDGVAKTARGLWRGMRMS